MTPSEFIKREVGNAYDVFPEKFSKEEIFEFMIKYNQDLISEEAFYQLQSTTQEAHELLDGLGIPSLGDGLIKYHLIDRLNILISLYKNLIK